MAAERRHYCLRWVVCAAATVLALWIALSPPMAGLQVESMRALGVMAWAAINWIYGPFPDYLVSLMMLVAFALSGAVTFQVSFSIFGSSVWWMTVGAIGLGAAVQDSGLLKRLSLKTLLVLPDTFAGQCIGLAIAGIILSPALATCVGKAVIASRLVLGMAEALDLPERGNHSAGLFMSMFLGFVLSTPLYMTASIGGFVILGLMPEGYEVSWIGWIVQAAPLVLPVCILVMLAIIYMFRPKDSLKNSRDYLVNEWKAMGGLTRNEVVTLAVLGAMVVLWATEPVHHVDATIVTLASMIALVVLGVLDKQQIDHLPWSTMVFYGGALSLSTVLQATQIDLWLGSVLTPLVSPMAGSPVKYLWVISLIVIGLRFLVVSPNSLLAVLMVSLAPVSLQNGIHPWVLGLVVFLVGQTVFMFGYQNPIYLICYDAVEGKMNTQSQATIVSVIALASIFIGIVVAVSIWRYSGLVAAVAG